jgi:phosphotransferase system HPr (HPr) family protein
MSANSETGSGAESANAATEPAGTTAVEIPAAVPAPSVVEVAVVLPADLHARPAGRLTRDAARFTSDLVLQYGERTANARGVLAVMALGATRGRTVIVRAQGPDAREAAESLAEILATAQ